MSRPGQLGHGRPAGSPEKQFAAQLAELKRQLAENTAMTKKAVQLANAALNYPTHMNASQTGITFSTSYTDYPLGTITVPDGCTNFSYWVWATAGATFSAASNISVRALVSADGGTYYGDAIACGIDGAGPQSSMTAWSQGNGTPLTPGDVITYGASVAIAGTQTAGSGNVHISVAAIFTR